MPSYDPLPVVPIDFGEPITPYEVVRNAFGQPVAILSNTRCPREQDDTDLQAAG